MKEIKNFVSNKDKALKPAKWQRHTQSPSATAFKLGYKDDDWSPESQFNQEEIL